MKYFIPLLGTVALVCACGRQEPPQQAATPETQPADPPAKATLVDDAVINKALKNFVDNQALIGVSALIYEDGKEAYFGAFGQADREEGRPMQRDTIVQIFSMTKPVTGAVLMTLYEEGRFQLDDPLAKYAPEFADMKVYAGEENGRPVYEDLKRPITIRDLMRHTAGFYGGEEPSPVRELYQAADATNRNNTLVRMAEKLGGVPLLYQPGTRWLYSPSVDVQAFLAERLAGKPFDQLLQERIFDPLKMQDTSYFVPQDKRARFAALYTRSEDGTFTRQTDEQAFSFYFNHWPLTPGGWGLTSTLDDYMRFARMLLNGGELDGVRILRRETIELMATDAMPAEVTDKSWLPDKGQVGFGINFAVRTAPPVDKGEASGTVGEFFWDGAANTLFWVDPKNNIAAVLFTQYRPFGGVSLHKSFRDAVYQADTEASAMNKPEPATSK